MSEDDAPARWNAETVAVHGNKPVTGTSVFDAVQPRFDEVGELGRGGMGRVAEARDRALDRTVAIKHMLAPPSGDNTTGLARFEREVRITARLQHPGIVPVLEAGRDGDGHPYYVMRKIDGVPLADRVAKRRVRERVALIPAILPAVDAVAYAHAQGIVHRDIKPWNILLGSFGEALMIDWGLARDLASTVPDSFAPSRPTGDSALTQLGSAYGTPGFMAPEQARGEMADRRADVYSLGATLYFVLAAASPFAGVEPTVAIDKAAAGEMPDMTKLDDAVPVELVAIVTKALSPKQDDRYGDAGELASDLRRFVAGQLVAAHRYTAWQRVRRWIAKHRLVTAISAIAIVVIAVGGAWSVRSIVRERDTAQTAQALAETRADELVIDHARSLVATDGTSAIAALRGLAPMSPSWPVAREIVRAAMAAGVERRVSHHPHRVTAIAFSPHGRLASSALASGGHAGVSIHDLTAGTSFEIAGTPGGGIAWFDDRKLAMWDHQSGGPDVLAIVDVDTRAVTEIPVGPFDHLAVDAGRAVIHRRDGSVVTSTPDGRLAELATNADAVDARAGRIALASRSRLTIIEPDGSHHDRALDLHTAIFHVSLSSAGTRVAIHAYKWLYECDTSGDGPVRSWPSATDAANLLAYAGERLFAWSGDGTGVAELRASDRTTRWLAQPGFTLGLVPVSDGATTVFATSSGRIAVATALGVIELRHRPEAIARIAYDDRGRRLAIGTDNGDVEVVELGAAIPEVITLAPHERLYAVGRDRVLVGTESTTEHELNALQHLDIIDTSGKRHPFPPLTGMAHAAIRDDLGAIVAVGGDHTSSSFVVTDLDGVTRYRHDGVGSHTIDGQLVFATDSGDVIRLDERWQPHTIAHTSAPPFVVIDVPAGIVITTGATGAALLVDAAGSHELPVAALAMPTGFCRTSDGTWWVIDRRTTLWRIPAAGTAAPVSLPQDVKLVTALGDRIFATGHSAIFELARDGQIIRSTSGVGVTVAFDDGYLLATDTGIAAVMLAANLRSELRIGIKPDRIRTTRDGRVMAAAIDVHDGDDHELVAIWRDPVPVDLAELPAFLGRLTNARLDPGSDELRWDAR